MILNILLVITRIHSFKGRIRFQELDILDCNMTNSSQLLISVKVPNLILGIETSLLELLGHSPKALYGQSIEIFRGPETDLVLVVSALQAAGLKQALAEFEVILYERSGQPRVVAASFSPCTRTLGLPVCSILTLNFCASNFFETTAIPNSYNCCDISSTYSSFESSSAELADSCSQKQELLPTITCCESQQSLRAHDGIRCLTSYHRSDGTCSGGDDASSCYRMLLTSRPATLDLDFAEGAEDGAADGWGSHGGGGSWSGFENRGGWPDWANTAAPPPRPALAACRPRPVQLK